MISNRGRTHDTDSVVTLSVSESLKKIPCENTVKYLPNLVEVVLGSEEGFALDAMLAIQFNCKFYNYEIHKAKLKKDKCSSTENGKNDRPLHITNNYIEGDQIQGDKIEGDKYTIDRVGNLNTGTVNIHGNQNGEQ
jgi:hypothetical protein